MVDITNIPTDWHESLGEPGEIGPYRLLETLGEGGMGIVYLAEQQAPVRRTVALKLIKLGMDTKQVIARFESERQALAMMSHPNVAKALDAGVTTDGRPYFVMEHVPGVPITEYCDTHRLTVDERLGLFVQVCHAIQHAHQNGIIHRDLKPSNVLVAVEQEVALPKVIDFGVAKATGPRLTEKTLYTEQGQMIGTPEYMSPEQAEMTGLNVDTRSDIYSLGALLYELLVGALPFDSSVLRRAGIAEIQRTIREVDPPRPSTRITGLEESELDEVAKSRRSSRPAIKRELRGDLDWIILKAMDKDRTRRYASAFGLAADIHRHLRNEPVAACPPSTVYRARKFVRRNRPLVLGAAAVFVVLVGGIVGTTLQRAEAVRQARVAEAINDFITEMLTAPNPYTGAGKDVKMVTVLTQAADRFDGAFAGQPLVEAGVRRTLGTTLRQLGAVDEAEPHLDRALALRRDALGERDPATLQSMFDIAELHMDRRLYKDAEEEHAETLELREAVLGPDHRDTLDSMSALAVVYFYLSREEQAVALVETAYERLLAQFGEEDPDTLDAMNRLAAIYQALRRYDEAETLFKRAIDVNTREQGADHLDTKACEHNLGLLYKDMGRYREAEPLLRQDLELSIARLDEDHPATIDSKVGLASVLQELREYDETVRLFREVLVARERNHGSNHEDTLIARSNLAELLLKQVLYDRDAAARRAELLEEAREQITEAVRVGRFTLKGESEYYVGIFLMWKGRVLAEMGDLRPARSTLEEAQRILDREGESDPYAILTNGARAGLALAEGRLDEAELLSGRAVDAGRDTFGSGHLELGRLLLVRGRVLAESERYDDAEQVLIEAHETIRETYGDEDVETRAVALALADVYEAWEKPAEATRWRERLDG
jgi:non-specific serine/threonine protein kinase/serine/threonine-protein kinase